MPRISTLSVVGLFLAAAALCAFGGMDTHAFAQGPHGAHHHASPCSILAGCQAENPSEWGAGIPAWRCDGPLAVSSASRLSILIPQLIDHPPELPA